jgi:putative flavoprotein involved in K+ transport
MGESHDVIVIGAGQAGLTMSWALGQRGIEHVLLERDRVGERWRSSRWDSLMFQFPNYVLALPGLPYAGDDPQGFSHHTEVLRLLESYAGLLGAPVREHTEVTSVDRCDGSFRVETSHGTLEARAVVVATGPFQRPRIPRLAKELPGWVTQLHSADYRRPGGLPPGGVLVVGSGASGTQIAEELVEAGRSTHLSLSRHRRVPRRYAGVDVTDWLLEMGVMDRTRETWVDGRMPPTVLVTGVGGGHDLDVRELGERGVVLVGSVEVVEDDWFGFADNAEAILSAADTMYDEFVLAVDEHLRQSGREVPRLRPRSRREAAPSRVLSLRAAGITSVVWATGYDYDYGWLHAPCLDASGAPVQTRGVSDVPGLYFLGLHWMHTFKSGTFMGIADDATYVADHVLGHVRSPQPA